MSLIVIGFGGTGAKMVQALLMMGAAGALRLPRPVKILLVDQDRGNGNTLRTVETLETYRAVRQILTDNDDPIRPYNVDFDVYSDLVWQPLKRANECLGARFGYDGISHERDMSSRLLELLYSPAQINEPLNKGFLGNPNIGAPVFADTIDFEDQPWKDLDQDIATGLNTGGTRIVLCGSVFGGTGAAGIPNTAKILRHRLREHHNDPDHERAKIILNLAMPYFTIREVDGATLQAAGQNFLPNCKAALQYYHEQKYLDFCDALYVLGEADMAPIDLSFAGDREQKNSAHPIELFAACNIFDALVSEDLDSKFILCRRARKEEYSWRDIPLRAPLDLRDFVRARMGAFARFSFALLCVKPGLINFQQQGVLGDNGWLTDYFQNNRDLDLSKLAKIEKLSRMFLEWAGEMQLTAASMADKHNVYRAEWFDHQQIVDGDPRRLNVHLKEISDQNGLEKLVLPRTREEFYSYRNLHSYLTKLKNTKTGFSGLVNGFYQGCGQSLVGFSGGIARRANV